MRRRYVTVDVFTDRAFGGNPLAVVLDAAGLSAARMQAVAAEFNYSETAFVLPPADPAHSAHVRIFTPKAEMPFAGHPNVGTAYVLAREGAVGDLLFEEAAGLVPVRILRADGEVTGAELTAPRPLSRGRAFDPALLAAALGLDAADIAVSRHPPCVASVGLPFVIAELASRDALARIRPALAGFQAFLPCDGANSIFAYVPDGSASVQARMFMPFDGLIEDPATGSAAAALAALLADLDPAGPDDLLVRQGFDMGRPSLLLTRVRREAGRVASVHVGGACVPMFAGTFDLAGDAA